jgi:protein-S-isoprenylcysteine O-methyltransferase Ste14
VFLVVVPGFVAGLAPALITGYRTDGAIVPLQIVGGALIAGGLLILVTSFVRFVIEGLGTPAPVAPTKHLVVGGPYRYVRNAMYLAVGSIIIGQALLFGNYGLLVYAAVFFALAIGFVKLFEEPVLEADYGEEYLAYKEAVPGWRPRLRPWTPPSDQSSAGGNRR